MEAKNPKHEVKKENGQRLKRMHFKKTVLVLIALTALTAGVAAPTGRSAELSAATTWDTSARLLTQPMLQYPTEDSVRVVWYTEFEGSNHTLTYTPTGGSETTVAAETIKTTRMYEDEDSNLADGREIVLEDGLQVAERDIWRHEAVATDLIQNERVPYFVSSDNDDEMTITSGEYTLQPLPTEDQGIKVLLTSDQQNRQMSPANFQKVIETVGIVDAVFFAGDFVDNPNRASEWFDRYNPGWLGNPGEEGGRAYPSTRPSFFPALQGYYQDIFPEFPYNGGEILQNAYMFGTIGNHESPGRWRPDINDLGQMDGDPQPRWYAEMRYEQQKETINPTDDPTIREQWIQDNSFEHQQYFEMWAHPEWTDWTDRCAALDPDVANPESYYAYQIGDTFLISMNVSRVWRTWNVNLPDRGKYQEARDVEGNIADPDEWGFGDMWFERYFEGTEQYKWLQCVLDSEEFQNSRYKVVLGHQTMFGVGDNSVPVMADPVARIFYEESDETLVKEIAWSDLAAQWETEVMPILDNIVEVRYEYPVDQDVWHNDIEPLLVENGVQLLHTGHSHVWNRTLVEGLNYIETSNVGNSFGGYYQDGEGIVAERTRWASSFWDDLASENPRWNPDNYASTGDPQGRMPIQPTEFNPESELDGADRDLPFLSSNDVTAFTILDTGEGTVKSYVFDTRDPESEVRLFDQFKLGTMTSDPAPTTAKVGEEYSHTFTAQGDPAPTISVADGELPDGLTLDENGMLSGTPTTEGEYTFTVIASIGESPVGTETVTITVDPADPEPEPTTRLFLPIVRR